MKNFVQHGDTLTVIAPAAVGSGEGVLVGSIFGVAVTAAAGGADVPIKTTGVFDLPKIGSQEWSAGDLVYWDNANKRCTTVDTGNVLIGAAVAPVSDSAGDTIGRVRLNGVFGFPVAA
jgi:predicted RecA/RadA family phage recombinase